MSEKDWWKADNLKKQEEEVSRIDDLQNLESPGYSV